jgi:peptide/nickel transport system ATP-binding protein
MERAAAARPGADIVASIEDLSVVFPTWTGEFTAVDGVSFQVAKGEIVGLVGESGAGKSTVGNAIARLIDYPGRISRGRILLDGVGDLAELTEAEMCAVRGRRIGMIFQDPLTALSPVVSVGRQLLRAIKLSTGLTGRPARARALELFEEVGIPDPPIRLKQYPHQFSGGMRQRVVIAIALAGDPDLLIADEPTTALDVSIQAEVLRLLQRLGREHDAGIILVTHDMAVINEVADRVAVMRHGRLVEFAAKTEILGAPKQDYTRALIRAVPRTDVTLDRFELVGDGTAPEPGALDWSARPEATDRPVVEVRDLDVTFLTGKALMPSARTWLKAVDGVSFDILQGETFGLVGESGSGKSTVARVICGLETPSGGRVRFQGHDLGRLRSDPSLRAVRLSMQMIFQDPFSSLNPRQRVGALLMEPLRVHRLAEGDAARDLVASLLRRVGMRAEDGGKLPHQFSGGQRQRICIARALAMRPAFLICDEPTSALDVSVQAQVLNLLKDLQRDLGLTMLFISHDLAVIRQMCDRVAVMQRGELCELAETEALFNAPSHDYTRRLLSLMPKFALGQDA